ncbi:MAG: general secretion pathway protein D [Rickettsiales bacterium]|jgi:general secretion pathway protein D
MAQALTKKIFHNAPILLAILALFATFSGCTQGERDDVFDRQTNTTRQDAREALFGDKDSFKNSKIPDFRPIPKRSRMIAIPSFPEQNSEKLISLSVTQDVPLKDVLIELAKSANIDIDLDPSISGGVIVNAKNRPLTEILDRICEMGDLRYTLFDNRLHVTRDIPFSKNYSLDFLSDGDLWNVVPANVQVFLASGASSSSSGGSVSINKLANIMTIFASEKNHIKIVEYLASVRKNSSAQVLIEAKVVEVSLKDNYSTGINWDWSGGGASSLGQSAGGVSEGSPVSLVLGSSDLLGGSINATISALEEFGVVRAISSPRINALNNQTATLNFTKNLVYFTFDVSENNTTSNGVSVSNVIVDSTVNEILTGVELTITPVIDLLHNEITLNVEPKITTSSETADQEIRNPSNVSEVVATSRIPIVNTRELKTIAKLHNGNVLVIGGVMSEDTNNSETGIPFLQRIPILGNLFKSVSKTTSVTETVIFIKVTIIRPDDGVSEYDRKFSNTFTKSANPFLQSN